MKKLLLLIFILLPLTTFGAETYTLLEPLPCIENTGQTCESNGTITKIDTKTYLSYVYRFSIAFAAVAAVVMIMYAGFEYAMTDIISTKSAAKARMYNALMGLATLLASYLILQTIDPRLVQIDTQLPEISTRGVTFDYNQLVTTATDYAVRQSLDKALANSQVYLGQAEEAERSAASLRAQKATAQSYEQIADLEAEAARFDKEARDYKIKAKSVTALATADARYTLGLQKLRDYRFEGDPNAKQLKLIYEDGLGQIVGGIDDSKREIVALGGADSLSDLETKKQMQTVLYKGHFSTEHIFYGLEDGGPRTQQAAVNWAKKLAQQLDNGNYPKDVGLDLSLDSSYEVAPDFSGSPELQTQFREGRDNIIRRINAYFVKSYGGEPVVPDPPPTP